MNQYGDFGKETEELMTICERNDRIPPELFKEFGVKRGLRDVDGTGVLAGISNISRIDAFKTEDGRKAMLLQVRIAKQNQEEFLRRVIVEQRTSVSLQRQPAMEQLQQ